MIPKEKAKKLYDEMYKNCTMTIAGAGSIWKPLCKEQCLIVVREILENNFWESDANKNNYHKYWHEVQSEIEGL